MQHHACNTADMQQEITTVFLLLLQATGNLTQFFCYYCKQKEITTVFLLLLQATGNYYGVSVILLQAIGHYYSVSVITTSKRKLLLCFCFYYKQEKITIDFLL